MWAENGGAPDVEAVELNKAYGWEYVASKGQFHIFRSESARARELNTDPEVQAITVNMVRKRKRDAVIASFFWRFLYPVIVLSRKPAACGPGNRHPVFVLYSMLLAIWLFIGTAVRAVHTGRLRKKGFLS